jgi:hypothetical protein
MAKSTFKTNPVLLEELLKYCGEGKVQLPDFQRGWVWEEDRIKSLIASVSRAFPIGALMTLESKNGAPELFARRPLEGAPAKAAERSPEELLLDGQQRMTSLYQACFAREVVETITAAKKKVKRWFYIDIQKALTPGADRDEAIFGVPEDRRLKTNFDKTILLDLSTPDKEYENFVFPLNRVFDWDIWQQEFGDYWIDKGQVEKRKVFQEFKNEVLQNFKQYQVPVICLSNETSHEAVCLVFEKVNTGGKALDAFELLTAMYAAQGHRLRDDWFGTEGEPGLYARLSKYGHASGQKVGVLAKVASTDILQAIALRHTKKVRMDKIAEGVKENDLPAVRATKQSLLGLPLSAYREYKDSIEEGFEKAAKFLRQQNIHRVLDLPYQSQLVPLAAIFSEIGDKSEHATNQAKIARWFWCGIFGELYGSAGEGWFVRDIMEVPAWLDGGPEPSTVTQGVFRPDRLNVMRTRQSAAYKGIHALLMKEGAKDFRSGQEYNDTVFFEEGVDIHHIFPQKWCGDQKIDVKVYDTVINKTPLTYRTNRIIGGVAPSKYIAKLENGKGGIEDPSIPPAILDSYIKSHCISVEFLRADNFTEFMVERKKSLLKLIEAATGHNILDEGLPPEEGEELSEELARDNALEEQAA